MSINRKRGSIDLARQLCYQINGAADDSDDIDGGGYGSVDIAEILSAEVVRLQEALAQPEQEAVGYWKEQAEGLQRDYDLLLADYEKFAQQEQEPVAMLERDPSIGRLRVTYEDAVTKLDEGVYPLYTKPQGWSDNVAQAFKVKERLIRIMGTFDLATGHADKFDELLDSLESELRDVLGYYRQQRTWVGLTDVEIEQAIELISMLHGDYATEVAYVIEAKLKERNT